MPTTWHPGSLSYPARANRLADGAEAGGALKTALAGVRELAHILEIEALG